MAESDDQRKRRDRNLKPVVNALVASARLLTERRIDRLPDPEAWQSEFWRLYDTTPEVRFTCGYMENGGTRVRLLAAKRGNTGDEPEPITSGPAFDLMESLGGGTEGQAAMMGDFFVHLTGPGKCYLVGEPTGSTDGTITAPDTWQVLSLDELEVDRNRTNTTETRYRVRIADGDRSESFRPLADDALVCDVWRSHKRKKYKPDSPMRAVLPILRELELMTAHVEASGVSRLAGAGILFIPTELVFPVSEKNKDAEDPFIAELMDAMLTPIADRDNASAVVPFVVRVPGDLVDKVQHLTFSTPFDEHAIALRDEAIRRFSTGVDLPAEVVTGLGSVNHWTGWQIEESALKLHIEPMSEAACLGITKGYLQPGLKAMGRPDPDAIVWYDTTELKVRPDRSADAKELWDRLAIDYEAMRRETGFDESDAPKPDEFKRMLALKLMEHAPTMIPTLLPLLGIDIPEIAQAPRITVTESVPGPKVPIDLGTPPTKTQDVQNSIPQTQNTPPPPPGPTAIAAAAGQAAHEAGLIAACDGLVVRALERAGVRLTNRARAAGVTLSGDSDTRHLAAPEQLRIETVEHLMEGAWDRVPRIAERYGIEPVALTATLDSYTRSLLLAGAGHDHTRLAEVLGADEEAA